MLPLHGLYSFDQLAKAHHSVGLLMVFMDKLSHSTFISWGLNTFSNVAITTSFLGVTLGLFDFLADGFQRPNTKKGRFHTAMMTFLPPLFLLKKATGITLLSFVLHSFSVPGPAITDLLCLRCLSQTPGACFSCTAARLVGVKQGG